MKKLFFIPLLVCTLLWMGCPVGLDYSLAEPGKEKIDKGLVGTWDNGNDEETVKSVRIKADGKYKYRVEVLEKGELYSPQSNLLTAWVTQLDGTKFIYLQADGEETFYHYQYKISGKTLTTVDMALLDGGLDAVTSRESLRKQVSKSMKMDDWGKEHLDWTKQ